MIVTSTDQCHSNLYICSKFEKGATNELLRISCHFGLRLNDGDFGWVNCGGLSGSLG